MLSEAIDITDNPHKDSSQAVDTASNDRLTLVTDGEPSLLITKKVVRRDQVCNVLSGTSRVVARGEGFQISTPPQRPRYRQGV